MAAPDDESAVVKRANWVGLRTLRQRPKVVDHTKSGQPVFEVRSVRLLLPESAGHFTRLVHCSRCGNEVPGSPVLSAGQLDQSPHAVICQDCVRQGSTPSVELRRPSPAPAPKSVPKAPPA